MVRHDFSLVAIRRHLGKRDAVMAGILRTQGKCGLVAKRGGTVYEALAGAIFHQQLNGKAAATIRGRVEALVGGRFPTAEEMLGLKETDLRAAGLSGGKVLAMRDLAAKALDGTLPSARGIHRLSDEEIIERCTAVRGIGRWTVEMLLIFKLGRPDVLPADDFGVRNGYRVGYGKAEMPRAKELLEFGEVWRPWRSVAAWYLWRVADGARGAVAKE